MGYFRALPGLQAVVFRHRITVETTELVESAHDRQLVPPHLQLY
jgi:hypothetical protein